MAVSRIERAKRGPSAASLIACSIVFGLSARELFPSIYGEVEDNVLSSARTLVAELTPRTDAESKKVRVLLEDLIQRITNRDKSQKL